MNSNMIENREEFAKYLQEFNQLGIGAEIGVDRGVHGRMLLLGFKGTILFVDPWKKFDDWESDINNRDYDRALNLCIKNIKRSKRSIILRGTSEDVSRLILDESLDFVYIDAQHSYKGCMDDINYWYSKVRKGGVVAGHDYYNAKKGDFINNTQKRYVEDFGVKQAVDEFASKYGYKIEQTKTGSNWYFIK